jgi:hypothetical protein
LKPFSARRAMARSSNARFFTASKPHSSLD